MVDKIEVGKTYTVSNEPFWEILHIHDDKVMRKITYKYKTKFDVVDIMNISQWKEIKENKILYCSIWTQKSGYVWSISYVDKAGYDKTVNDYKECEYIPIKEWELEYEAP